MTTIGQNPDTDNHFDAIMQLHGAEELKGAVARLRKFQENKSKYSVSDARLPNHLWVAKRGGGVTTCLNAFAEFLYAAKTIEFAGIVKYFEFTPIYISPNEYLSGLTRLNNILTEIAGHNRHFKGIACIVIDEWLEHTNEPNFKKIIDFVEHLQDKIMTVFVAHTGNRRFVENAESAISSYMRCETVTLRFPDTDELVAHIETKYLGRHGFVLAGDAKSLLAESIAEMAKSQNFYGFKTISQLAGDVIYSLLASDLDGNEISAGMLGGFAKNSTYIKRMKTSNYGRTMGFEANGGIGK